MSLLSEDREPFRLLSLHAPSPQDESDLFSFGGSVGPNGDNRREDVIKAQLLLSRSGDFDPEGVFRIPTGWPSSDLYRGIKKFQQRSGRNADGTLLPIPPGGVDDNGVGETLEALRDALGEHFAGKKAPTPQQVDEHYENGGSSSSPSDGQKSGSAERAATPVTRSDVDLPNRLLWQDGAQVAQIAVNPGSLIRQPVLTPGSTGGKNNPYPHEQPDVKAAGRQLEQLFGNAAANMTRWYENAQAVHAEARQRDQRLDEADLAAFTTLPGAEGTPPSRPLSESDQAQTKTPPFAPPEVDDKLQGRPTEERGPILEKLIPPEMKEWIGTLPPQEQLFAEDLAGILVEHNQFGGRGKPETVRANRIAAQVCLEVLKEFPKLDGIAHVKGSENAESGAYQKEEVIPKEGAKRNAGSSRPDGTYAHGTNGKLIARFNTVDILKNGSESIETETMTANETRRYNNLLSNIKEGVAGWARKMRPGESEESYRKNVAIRCRDMWRRLDDKLDKEGEFGKRQSN